MIFYYTNLSSVFLPLSPKTTILIVHQLLPRNMINDKKYIAEIAAPIWSSLAGQSTKQGNHKFTQNELKEKFKIYSPTVLEAVIKILVKQGKLKPEDPSKRLVVYKVDEKKALELYPPTEPKVDEKKALELYPSTAPKDSKEKRQKGPPKKKLESTTENGT